MAISHEYIKTNTIDEKTDITSGNEVIFRVASDAVVTVEAIPTVAGTAQTYTSLQEGAPTTFDDMVPVATISSTAYQDGTSIQGQRWVGVKVSTGTWKIRVSTQENTPR